MPNVQSFADLDVFTADASSLLANIKGVTYTFEPENADSSAIKRIGKRRQTVKKGVTVATGTMSTLTGDASLVASNLAVSAMTLGGTSILNYLRGGSISGSFDVREVSGVADPYRWPQIFGKDYEVELNLLLPAAGDSQVSNMARVLSPLIHDPDLTDQDLTRVTWSMTIDNVTITIPMIVQSYELTIRETQEQELRVRLSGCDPGSGAYPTSPTGTSTLLEAAFNAFNTPIALVLTTAAAGAGVSYSFNAIITRFGFSFNDAEITMIDYTFSSRGNVTAVTV